MRKIITLISVIAFAFVASGCGEDETQSYKQYSEVQTSQTVQTEITTTTAKIERKILTKEVEFNGIKFKVPSDCTKVYPGSEMANAINLRDNQEFYNSYSGSYNYNGFISTVNIDYYPKVFSDEWIESNYKDRKYTKIKIDGVYIVKAFQDGDESYYGNLDFHYNDKEYKITVIFDKRHTYDECSKVFDQFVDTLHFR